MMNDTVKSWLVLVGISLLLWQCSSRAVAIGPGPPDATYSPPFCNDSFVSLLPLGIAASVQVCTAYGDQSSACVPTNISDWNPAAYRHNESRFAGEVWLMNPLDEATMTVGFTLNETEQLNPPEYIASQELFFDSSGPTRVPTPWELFYSTDSAPSLFQDTFSLTDSNPNTDSHTVASGYFWKDYHVYRHYALLDNRVPDSNFTCGMVVDIKVRCCSNAQPPVLVAQPYEVLVLSTVTFFMTAYLFAYIKLLLDMFRLWREKQYRRMGAFFRRTWNRCLGRDESQLERPLLTNDQIHLEARANLLTMSERLTRANGFYLVIQLTFAVLNLGYLIVKFNFLDQSDADANKSAFWRYQIIYMFWANSSQATLLSSSLASYLLIKYQLYKSLEIQGKLPPLQPEASCATGWTCRCCCSCCRAGWAKLKQFYRIEVPSELRITKKISVIVLVLFSPAFFTHVLPMWLVYLPFLVVGFTVFVFLAVFVYFVFYLTQYSANKAVKGMKALPGAIRQGATVLSQKYEEARTQFPSWWQETKGKVTTYINRGNSSNEDSSGSGGMGLGGGEMKTMPSDQEEVDSASEQETSESVAQVMPYEPPVVPYEPPAIRPVSFDVDSSQVSPVSQTISVAPEPNNDREDLSNQVDEVKQVDEAKNQSDASNVQNLEQTEDHSAVSELDGSVVKGDGVNATSPSQSPTIAYVVKPPRVIVELPWYAVLLLRLLIMVTVIAFMQTTFNYGYIIYTGGLGTDWKSDTTSISVFVRQIWIGVISDEYNLRTIKQWLDGMTASWHALATQVMLFV